MRVTKWIFFGYLALTALVVLGIGASFMLTPARDPNTYFLSYAADIKSLDPAEINDVESDTIAANIFECLYVYKYGVTPYELQPCLAEGMPEVSADGLTMRLHIKKGVHYYDPEKRVFPSGTGPEVTAADFIYAWKRVSNFKLASTQYTGVFEGKVEGLDDWYAYTEKTPSEQIDWDRPVSGLQSPDRYTLVIKLKKRDPQMRYNLAHTPTAALCRQVAEYWGDKLKDHPVGTGPYMLEEQLKEQRIVLAANPAYRGGPDVESDKPPIPEERLPHIARVQFDYFSEALPEWLLFRQGMFDAAGIPKDTFKQAITATGSLTPEMEKEGIELIKAPAADVWYYGFNMSDPLVGKNKALRQAMSMAFDRESYIKVYLNGRGQPAIGPIPPGFPTYDANQVNPYTRFDLAAAKAKLKEAERCQGGPIPPMTLLMPGTDTSVRQIAENFVSEMEALGLTMKIEYSNWARFQERVDSKQAQIYLLGWVADYPDEETFLQLFFGKNAGVNGINSSNYQNPAYDALYETAEVMSPGPERDALYRKLEAIVMEDSPWLLVNYSTAYALHYRWLHNVKPMDFCYGNLMYRSLDFADRAAWFRHH